MSRAGRLSLAFFLALAAACSDERGAADHAARAEDAPTRVISLIPAATEMVLAMGAGDRLAARTDYDRDTAVADLPSVGQGLTPSLEELMALRPDLVIAWPDNASRSVIARLRELDIAVYTPAIQTLEDITATIEGLGERLGLEDRADSLVASMEAELERVRRAVAGRERPDVLYVVWYDPPTTAGPETFISQLIELAGGRNVFADAPGLWPQVSIEEVVRRDPDILLVPRGEDSPIELDRLKSATGWRQLRAVRNDRVVPLDAKLFNRPGPSVTAAARRLAEILHPQAIPAGTGS